MLDTMKLTEASIVIPIFNEGQLLKKHIPDFIEFIKAHSADSEIILIENGSRDDSARLVDKLADQHQLVRALHLPTASFGAAVRIGLLAADRPRAILLNADWLDRQFVLAAPERLAQADILVGSKIQDPSLDHRPAIRRLASHLLNRIIHLGFGYNSSSDTHGIKAFNMARVRPVLEICKSDEIIETELLIRASRRGLKIEEVAVPLSELRAPRNSFAGRILTVAKELLILRRVLKSNGPLAKLHVDDAGYDTASVDALIQLCQAGRVVGISVLASAPAVDYFCRQFQTLPANQRPKLWLHFNLVEGPPQSAAAKVLADQSGQLKPRREFLRRALFGNLDQSVVAAELAAQLAKLENLGLKIDGIDSHQHMHAFSPVAEAVAALAKQRSLSTRGYRQMRTKTIKGRLKFWLFKAGVSWSALRHQRRRWPASWRVKGDSHYLVASWEAVSLAHADQIEFIVCHPKTGFDVKPIQ